MKRYLIETWGCQMNVHDSEKMGGILVSLGYAPAPTAEEADVILLNTCSVREKPESKVYDRLGQLRLLKEVNRELLIGVCGCVAQQEQEAIFRRAPYVDLVMGPRHIAQLGELLDRARRDGRSISLARDDDPVAFPSGTASRGPGPRAYVTVMEGCNKSCTYCIVPYTRGREAYRHPGEILAEVRSLASQGYREIELLGQNVNAYHSGADDLASVLRLIDGTPGVRRVRFTTSHPGHLSHRIMNAMRDLPTVCNHLHLPAQSGSDRILQAMRRGYTRSRYMAKIGYLRNAVPGIALSTDLIVGFPGETEGDFAETLSLMRDVEYDQVYAFSYSPRPGTPAAGMDGAVPEPARRARLQTLLGLQERIQSRRNTALIGREFEVLVDGESRLDSRHLKGRTTCNRIVHFPGPKSAFGSLVNVRITRSHAHSLTGEPLEGLASA
jgi:tRNA-2-methylthio-N6-dimethylallyladenosine synthase